ncbi:hypothetical protein J6590_024178 [Homalodisca vitripennis]|nr:hypothetical protein J6590_024178 [Homalodisca vitripennis]
MPNQSKFCQAEGLSTIGLLPIPHHAAAVAKPVVRLTGLDLSGIIGTPPLPSPSQGVFSPSLAVRSLGSFRDHVKVLWKLRPDNVQAKSVEMNILEWSSNKALSCQFTPTSAYCQLDSSNTLRITAHTPPPSAQPYCRCLLDTSNRDKIIEGLIKLKLGFLFQFTFLSLQRLVSGTVSDFFGSLQTNMTPDSRSLEHELPKYSRSVTQSTMGRHNMKGNQKHITTPTQSTHSGILDLVNVWDSNCGYAGTLVSSCLIVKMDMDFQIPGVKSVIVSVFRRCTERKKGQGLGSTVAKFSLRQGSPLSVFRSRRAYRNGSRSTEWLRGKTGITAVV